MPLFPGCSSASARPSVIIFGVADPPCQTNLSGNLLIAWGDWLLFKDGRAEWMGAVGYPAGASPVCRRAANGFDCVLGPHHPSSRTVRANCDRREREVAGRAARQTSAEKGEMGPRLKPRRRRLFC